MVASHFCHLNHEIPVNGSSGLVWKNDCLSSLLAARFVEREKSKGDGGTRLPQNEQKWIPTIMKVLVGHTISNCHHGRNTEIKSIYLIVDIHPTKNCPLSRANCYLLAL
jgi:hypothetical protein